MKTLTELEVLSKKLDIHSNFITNAFIIALWFTSILMFIIMGVGFYKIVVGVINETHLIETIGSESNGIITILQGLELIFVSPLFYLLTLSLTKYISASKPEVNPVNIDEKRKFMNHSIMEIMNVKILSTGLFISISILHFLTLIIKNQMSDNLLLYIAVLLIILIGYYFVLDKTVEKLRK